MAQGKALNTKSFYGSNEAGSVADIAMPAYDEVTPISSSAPDPWANEAHFEQNNESAAVAPVPDHYEMTEEVQQEEVEEAPAPAPLKSKSPQESFKEIRAAKERAERERDAMMSQIIEMQARLQSLNQQSSQPVHKKVDNDDVDFDIDIEEDSLAEGKHVKRVAQEIKALKNQLKQYQNQSQESIIEARIKSQFPDFEQVVSRENVEALNAQYPEIAQALSNSSDIYNKAASAYAVIKKFGIHQDPIIMQEKKQLIANSQKPRPLASVNPQQGDSPLSRANAFANGLTEELKAQLRREMFESRKAH